MFANDRYEFYSLSAFETIQILSEPLTHNELLCLDGKFFVINRLRGWR